MKQQTNFQKLVRLPSYIIMGAIRLYQNTLSPDHGWFKAFYPQGYCRFYPTCSEYGYESISSNGITKGCIKTVWRILRCNPLNKGGIDHP